MQHKSKTEMIERKAGVALPKLGPLLALKCLRSSGATNGAQYERHIPYTSILYPLSPKTILLIRAQGLMAMERHWPYKPTNSQDLSLIHIKVEEGNRFHQIVF